MEIILTSILAFASTNIDDIFILMLFFADSEYNSKQVVLGQYLGFITLITISVVGSLLGLLVDQKYIGVLGLLPVYIGIYGIARLFKHTEGIKAIEGKANARKFNKTLSVAFVTFANGGDNIGIYIPLFATLSMPLKTIMVSIFLVMVGLWCFAARYLSKHPVIARTIDKYGHIITPIVLVLLGIYILYQSGTLGLISKAIPKN
ncbi:MAG: cadmium resistance transporter [Bacteroidota bacterium]